MATGGLRLQAGGSSITRGPMGPRGLPRAAGRTVRERDVPPTVRAFAGGGARWIESGLFAEFLQELTVGLEDEAYPLLESRVLQALLDEQTDGLTNKLCDRQVIGSGDAIQHPDLAIVEADRHRLHTVMIAR